MSKKLSDIKVWCYTQISVICRLLCVADRYIVAQWVCVFLVDAYLYNGLIYRFQVIGY